MNFEFINWRHVPLNSPIRIDLLPLKNSELYHKKFLKIPFNFEGRSTHLLVPYKRFMTELKQKPVEEQKQLLTQSNDVIIIKHPKNKLSIYFYEMYIKTLKNNTKH